jgi:hypothetical protein
MKLSMKLLAVILFAVAVVALAVAVAANKWPHIQNSKSNDAQKRDDPVIETLPPIVSNIKGIEILNTGIDAERRANITVINNTGKAIVGLSLCCGNLTFSDDNGISQENPRPLISPGGSYTFQEPISNLRAHDPIRICAALYSDDSEEGDAIVRKNIHNERERERQKRLGKAGEK